MGLKLATWAAVAHERTLFISLQPGFGKTVDDDTLRCGSSHREVLLFGLIMSQPCPACGASCSTGARFCSGCGSQITLAPPPDSRLGFALSQPVGEFCELRCGAFFSHWWKAYGILRGGRYYFNDEDQICPRCGRRAVSAMGQTDRMIQEQRKSNFWLALLYLFRR
jgi:hypothetical protein